MPLANPFALENSIPVGYYSSYTFLTVNKVSTVWDRLIVTVMQTLGNSEFQQTCCAVIGDKVNLFVSWGG